LVVLIKLTVQVCVPGGRLLALLLSDTLTVVYCPGDSVPLDCETETQSQSTDTLQFRLCPPVLVKM
jgi:hypothetical protein